MDGKNSESLAVRILKDILFFRWLKRLYEWVLHWADTPYGEPMLGFLSFIESSFFPIPPDVLLIPLAISKPKRAFRYAAITMVASVLGGMLGYAIGLFLWESVGIRIIQFYDLMDQYYIFREWYDKNVLAVTFLAGLTPLPYKVFTIAAGVMEASFLLFVLGSITSRSIRFFLEATFCYFGDYLSERVFKMPIKDAIDKYLNPLAITFAVLLVAGFVVIRYVIPSGTIDLTTNANISPVGSVQVRFYSEPAGEPESEEAPSLNYYLKLIDPDGMELASKDVLIPGVEKVFPFHHGEPELEVLKVSGREKVIALSFFTSGTETIPCTDGLLALYHLDEDKELVQGWSKSYPRLRHIDADHDVIGEASFSVADTGKEVVVEVLKKDVRFVGKGRDRNQRVDTRTDRYLFVIRAGGLELVDIEVGKKIE
jgi:membrane protein YqaA with SNARE-associated domain